MSPSPEAEPRLTVTDARSGREYAVPIKDGVIRATDLRQIKAP